MSRELLEAAVDAIGRAAEATANADRRDRLDRLGSQLESQADRDATPALGTLDRILTKLGEIETETDEQSVADAIGEAREHVLSFLGTLDDRGMKQHREN